MPRASRPMRASSQLILTHFSTRYRDVAPLRRRGEGASFRTPKRRAISPSSSCTRHEHRARRGRRLHRLVLHAGDRARGGPRARAARRRLAVHLDEHHRRRARRHQRRRVRGRLARGSPPARRRPSVAAARGGTHGDRSSRRRRRCSPATTDCSRRCGIATTLLTRVVAALVPALLPPVVLPRHDLAGRGEARRARSRHRGAHGREDLRVLHARLDRGDVRDRLLARGRVRDALDAHRHRRRAHRAALLLGDLLGTPRTRCRRAGDRDRSAASVSRPGASRSRRIRIRVLHVGAIGHRALRGEPVLHDPRRAHRARGQRLADPRAASRSSRALVLRSERSGVARVRLPARLQRGRRWTAKRRPDFRAALHRRRRLHAAAADGARLSARARSTSWRSIPRSRASRSDSSGCPRNGRIRTINEDARWFAMRSPERRVRRDLHRRVQRPVRAVSPHDARDDRAAAAVAARRTARSSRT